MATLMPNFLASLLGKAKAPVNGSASTLAQPIAWDGARRTDQWEFRYAKLMHFGAKKRVRLYQRLQRFTGRNIPLKQSIEIIHARLNRTGDSRRAVFSRVIEDMAEGATFTDSMADTLPGAERLLIYSGEQSGQVHVGFEQAAYVAEVIKKMRAAVSGTLKYPAWLFVILCLILWGISAFFIPILLQISPLSQWPLISKILYYVATTVQTGGVYIIAGLIALCVVIVRVLPTWSGPGRAQLDRWAPVFNTYREYQGSIFLISLAALIDSGRPDVDAIKMLSEISRPWLRQHLTSMHTALLMGVAPGRALSTGLLNDEVCGDVEDYASVGAFDLAIAQIGKDTIEDALERINSSAAVLRSLMMALVAAAVVMTYSGILYVGVGIYDRAQSGNLH